MAPRTLPSFFKILLDPSAPHLPLPPDFISKHLENNIPKNPILRSRNGGYSWRLKIKKIGSSYCFADGWNNVVEDKQLGFGDFLLFWLIDKSTFKVSIYSPNGCEKDLPSNIKVEHDGGGVDDDEDEDDGEDSEDGDGDDDEDIDDDEDNDEDEDEDDEGDIDGDDGDPFFMTIFSKTHNSLLRLPLDFVELAGIDNERTLKVKNLDGEECKTSLRVERCGQKLRYYLSSGWRQFVQKNDVSEGDECVFKFLKSEDKLLLAKVTKKKPPARQSGDDAPATQAVKRKRGRPPRRGVEVESEDDCVEVVKPPCGRPPKQESRVVYF